MAQLLNEFIGATLEAYMAKFFDIDAGVYRLLRKFLTWSSSMALIATFVRRKSDTAFADQNAVLADASKKGTGEATKSYGEMIEAPPSKSDLGSEEAPPQQVFQTSTEKSLCEA